MYVTNKISEAQEIDEYIGLIYFKRIPYKICSVVWFLISFDRRKIDRYDIRKEIFKRGILKKQNQTHFIGVASYYATNEHT